MKKATKSSKTKPAQLTLLNPKCAGIDIGASELFVCIATSPSKQEVRSFPTFTADLQRMLEWLKANGIESVAMESTGVYWIVPLIQKIALTRPKRPKMTHLCWGRTVRCLIARSINNLL